jgi:hypothetical protein
MYYRMYFFMQTVIKKTKKTNAKEKSSTRLDSDGRICPKLKPVYCDAAYSSFGAKGVIMWGNNSYLL